MAAEPLFATKRLPPGEVWVKDAGRVLQDKIARIAKSGNRRNWKPKTSPLMNTDDSLKATPNWDGMG
jgi:hypothetical protein